MKRFWGKTKKVKDECMEWQGYIDNMGYGRFYYQGTAWKAHRVSWILTNGIIPDKKNVLHKCDNRKCVNPDHLFIGTQKDNMQDCVNKGRLSNNSKKGEDHPHFHKNMEFSKNTKLTENKVIEIRRLNYEEKLSYKHISKIFNVSESAIMHCCLRHTWKYLK